MASNNRRQAATMAVARGSRLGLTASAGSATMMGRSPPSPWRSASASASPANAPPPMTMLRCTDILDLLLTLLLLEYSWAKQVDETRVLLPSSRHSAARDRRKAEIPESGGVIHRTVRKRRPVGLLRGNDENIESAPMSNGLIDLISILDLEPIEVNMFRGNSPKTSWQRVFGGQVIGQAMVAACRTVEGR